MLVLLGLTTGENSDPALDQARQDTEAKARAFLRLCNINGSAFDLINRYEVSLWRQAVQLMVMLEGSVHPLAAITVSKQSQ
jgi:hypothetical protein